VELASNLAYKKWVSLSAFLGFAAFLLYLYFFTDLGGIASVIGRTNLFLYAAAFVCILGSVLFNALAWHRLLVSLKINVNFRMIFNLSWVGIFIDSIIPGGWSGDAFMAYLLSRDPKIDGGKTAASIVIKNVLELLIILLVSFFGIVLLALNYALDIGVILAIGTVITFLTLPLVAILYLSINVDATKRILGFLKGLYEFVRRRPANIEEFEKKIGKTIEKYRGGIAALNANPRILFQTIFLQATAWGFEIVALFLVFASIGYPIPADKVIITNTLSVSLQAQGIALAGFAQVVSSSVYTVLGIAHSYSVASTVLAGFASFWFKLVIAFFAFQFVVFSRCVPPFCMRFSWLRGKSCKEETVMGKSENAK
jgi:uncharacterized protein (TIRG00374 family)